MFCRCILLPVDSTFGVLKHLPEDNCNKGNMEDDNTYNASKYDLRNTVYYKDREAFVKLNISVLF